MAVFKVIEEHYGTKAALQAVTGEIAKCNKKVEEEEAKQGSVEKKPKLDIGVLPKVSPPQRDPAPIEDYYKPKISALGGPVLKATNTRAMKGVKKLSAVGMKPLSDYWEIKGKT